MRYKKHLALRSGLPLVGALAALAIGVPTASAAKFGDGHVTIVPTSKFKNVKITPIAPATRAGSNGIRFPIEDGQSTMSEAASGNFAIRGGIRLRRGGRSVTGTNCEEVLAGDVGRLRCRFSGKSKILFKQDLRAGKIQPDPDFAGLSGDAIRVKLTRSAAKFLNRRLRLRGSRRLRTKPTIGRKTLDAVRVVEVTGGESRTAYDQAFYDKLQSCGIRLEALQPATPFPPDGNAPRGGVVFPAGSGAFNARTLAGQLNLTGGTRLQRDDNPSTPQNESYQSDLTNFVFDLATTPPTLSAFASRFNQTLPIGTVEGATITKSFTDSGGSITISNGRLVISDLAAQVLSSDTGCELGPHERTIGTTSGTISVV